MSACLVMIVRDEASVILRCLTSVWPHVDEWCIVDTGSVDNTMAVIHSYVEAHPKPGRIHVRPWVDFAHNRTEALGLARAHSTAHWLFMMDADDSLNVPGQGAVHLPSPGPEACRIRVSFGSAVTYRTHFFARDQPWEYIGSTHECPQLATGKRPRCVETISDAFIDARTEGFRSKNPYKYRDDALALQRDFSADPSNSRALFYLAQSWRDADDIPRALLFYQQHADGLANGWSEERYVSCLNVAAMHPDVDVAVSYAWKALDLNPLRLEVAMVAMDRARLAGRRPSFQLYALGMYLEVHAARAPCPDFLFLQEAAYTWRFSDEFSLVALALGHFSMAHKHLAKAVLAAPPAQRPRLVHNHALAARKATVHALTFFGCFPPASAVYIHPVHEVFVRAVQLLRQWLKNAGHTVVSELAHASVQICVQRLYGASCVGPQPLIVVATEQPRSPMYSDPQLRALYRRADWVWAMDAADYLWLHEEVGIPSTKLRVLPLLFGTHYVPTFTCTVSTRFDVVQIGSKNARRQAVMDQIVAVRPHSAVHFTDSTFGEAEVAGLVCGAKVVVVPHFYEEPLVLGMHRLAFLLLVPGLVLVVEDAPLSVYCKLILNLCPNIVLVPYNGLATAVVGALNRPAVATDLSALHAFAAKLLAWDGTHPWTDVLLHQSTVSSTSSSTSSSTAASSPSVASPTLSTSLST